MTAYARTLSRHTPVAYVERPLSLLNATRGSAAARAYARRRLSGSRQLIEVEDDLHVFTPAPISPLGLVHARTNNAYYRRLARHLRRELARRGLVPDTVWSFDPYSQAVVGLLGERRLVYHCTQAFAAADVPGPIASLRDRQERLLASKADAVFATTPALARRLSNWSANVFLYPTAVDANKFGRALDRDLPVPEEYANIPPPRIGWVGMVSPVVDIELMVEVARQFPEASLVLIGATIRRNPSWSRLLELPNIHFLGFREQHELPGYLAGMEVCLIPYVRSEFVESVSSLKLYEYLAAGRKIVATDYPEARAHADALWVANTRERFVEAVGEALEAGDSRQAKGLAIARRNTWEARVESMLADLARC